MLSSTISAWLKNLGEIYSWLQSMFTHRIRYRGRKMLNNSNTVSEAQQNLIMKYTDSRTFLNHYLPRHVDTDMQNVINGRQSNKSLMCVITRISRWIDTRRPRHLTPKQQASIHKYLEYVEAVRAAIDNEEAKNVLRTDSILPEQIDLLEKLQNSRDEILQLLPSCNIAVILKAGLCIDNVNGRL
ncbi:hypothetical protein N7509_003863 [Penicillium cosmopolitanum]|uniref:Uncharacterized protein n=1 Tax=Penicillium cosmopolitanum TaxID=1131564 RepID=A0A9X0BBW7_9EURO|nr:uncharacterized protein N7509_003863 [Penicillium cosmopolitanum]KAJ5403992.1 hypothetical protein N7509_003863 [Penicillium cosmopolitanum]